MIIFETKVKALSIMEVTMGKNDIFCEGNSID